MNPYLPMNANQFEEEVRRIARELFPSSNGGAQVIDDRERDGVYVTEECVHIVEATTLLTKEKAEYDAKKTVELINKLRRLHPDRAVKGWFITKGDPTAHQHDVIRKLGANAINAMSFAQFQSRLVDARDYLHVRERHAFGSARNPETDSYEFLDEYVVVGLAQTDSPSNKVWEVRDVAEALKSGGRFILIGDYGTGKSMTLRQVFVLLKGEYVRNAVPTFPVYVNLRDHQGQDDPAEILERHARKVGFGKPAHLVRAWKAGYITLILDGFDEFTPLGVQMSFADVKRVRYDAMKALRGFQQESPRSAGVIIAGRDHFFDGQKDRSRGLGTSSNHIELSLSDFSEQQIEAYLQKKGIKQKIPVWIPSRPLLLGHLAAKRRSEGESVLDSTVGLDMTAEEGWQFLLNKIAEREARNESGVDADGIRKIMERLASKARRFSGGLGPLTNADMSMSFEEVIHAQPDARASQMLLRLPGLGVVSDDGARSFVDPALANACAIGDVSRFVLDPYSEESKKVLEQVVHPLGSLGVAMLRAWGEGCEVSQKQFGAVIREVVNRAMNSTVLLDVVRVSVDLGFPLQQVVTLSGLDLTQTDEDDWYHMSSVIFDECYFSTIDVLTHKDVGEEHAYFNGCLIGSVVGVARNGELPAGAFSDCAIDSVVESLATTNNLISIESLPLQSRVILTILKKVYDQSGSGRQEAALFRGLDNRGRQVVPDALNYLRKADYLIEYNRGRGAVWQPVRQRRPHVLKLIADPGLCLTDPLFSTLP